MIEELPARVGAMPSPELAKKIATVQKAAEVGALPKRHVEVKKEGVTQYTYDYTTESVLMEKIRPLLADEGVAVFYSDEIKSLNGNVAVVRVALTLIDGDSGQSFTMTTEGMAADRGDKMVNKAKTAAMRYLLWKWFLVPSEGDDPETDSVETSDKQPRAHVKMAKDADVEAFATRLAEAGFDRDAWVTKVLDPHKAEWEGVRADWLAQQAADLDKAIAKKAAPAE